jgi:hypothetical protein
VLRLIIDGLFQPGVAPIVGSVITAIVSINTLFLKWLIDNFKTLRQSIDTQGLAATRIEQKTSKMLEDHEDKDQSRHEENLYRFEKISVALARLGSSNGTYEKKN